MPYCYCKATVPNPKPTCSGCITANKIIVGCGQGLKPCGDTTIINLTLYNTNPPDAVYALIPGGWDPGDFTAVSLTAAGLLSVTTGNNYTPHGLHEIRYTVTKGKLQDFESIWICFDSPCIDDCVTCNTCTGECYGVPVPAVATATCGEADKTHNAATGLNLPSCDGTTTWAVSAPSAISPVISNVGMITYDITGMAFPGVTYRITWTATCSLYGMSVSGYIDVTILDLCAQNNVVCAPDEICNQCTGVCEEKSSDMSGSGSGIGSSGPIVVSS